MNDMRTELTGLVLSVALVACASPRHPDERPPVQPEPAAPASPPTPPEPTVAPAPPPAPAGPERFPGTAFPPPPITPPSPTTSKPGDGAWTRMGDALVAERAADEPAVVYRTVIHPHSMSRFMSVTIAAIDLRHARLHLSAGIDDPGADGLPSSAPPGLVPESMHDRLLLVFNGGFQPKHGRWGMMVAGTTLVPPRDGGCTVAMNESGVRIGSDASLRSGALDAYRQTPPCLVEDGELHPHLQARNERAWGGRDPKRKTRRRSAIGIDASGRVLFYGMGTEVGPEMLAKGMRAAGAVAAAQLDINWSWTKFLLFGIEGGELRVTSTLIPKTVHMRTGYVKKKAHRDFFYVTRVLR